MPSDDWMLEQAREQLKNELTIGNNATLGKQADRPPKKKEKKKQ